MRSGPVRGAGVQGRPLGPRICFKMCLKIIGLHKWKSIYVIFYSKLIFLISNNLLSNTYIILLTRIPAKLPDRFVLRAGGLRDLKFENGQGPL